MKLVGTLICALVGHRGKWVTVHSADLGYYGNVRLEVVTCSRCDSRWPGRILCGSTTPNASTTPERTMAGEKR